MGMSGSEHLWDLAFVVLQGLLLAFLLLHDWIPLGPFNDLAGVRSQVSTPALVVGTLVSSLPVAFTLALGLWYFGLPYPAWVKGWLVATFGLLVLGEWQAWWHPYFFGATPKKVARYQAMFGRTHAFLRPRHGIVPNTAHVALHAGTVLTLALAVYLGWAR
jgi:hypothetical protein